MNRVGMFMQIQLELFDWLANAHGGPVNYTQTHENPV